jgi:hypothetical protein
MCQFFISSKTWVCPDPESPKSLDPEPDSLKKGSETLLVCALWTVHEATLPPSLPYPQVVVQSQSTKLFTQTIMFSLLA